MLLSHVPSKRKNTENLRKRVNMMVRGFRVFDLKKLKNL